MDGRTDGLTDRETNTLALRGLEEPKSLSLSDTLALRGLEEPAHASRGLFLINTLLLYPSLSPYSQTDGWTDGWAD